MLKPFDEREDRWLSARRFIAGKLMHKFSHIPDGFIEKYFHRRRFGAWRDGRL